MKNGDVIRIQSIYGFKKKGEFVRSYMVESGNRLYKINRR